MKLSLLFLSGVAGRASESSCTNSQEGEQPRVLRGVHAPSYLLQVKTPAQMFHCSPKDNLLQFFQSPYRKQREMKSQSTE